METLELMKMSLGTAKIRIVGDNPLIISTFHPQLHHFGLEKRVKAATVSAACELGMVKKKVDAKAGVIIGTGCKWHKEKPDESNMNKVIDADHAEIYCGPIIAKGNYMKCENWYAYSDIKYVISDEYEFMSLEQIINAINVAGSTIGIGERRPETGNSCYGKFHVEVVE